MQKDPSQNDQENSDQESHYRQKPQQSDSKKSEQEPQSNQKPRKHKGIRKENKTINKQKARKQKNSKETALKETAQEIAKDIIEQMDKRYEADLKLYGKKPAIEKISYLSTLSKQLRNIYVCQQFLELGGLNMFEKWLKKLPDGHEPNLNLRKHLFEILEFLRVREDHIGKAQQLQRVIQRNKRSQTKQIRDLCENIVNKWNKIAYYDLNQ